MLNNIVNNLEQCGSKTLFNAVFIRPEQVVRFVLCILYVKVSIIKSCGFITSFVHAE